MGDASQIPTAKILHEALTENISKSSLLSGIDESKIAALVNVMHNHSFDLDNKKLEKALDHLIDEILNSQ